MGLFRIVIYKIIIFYKTYSLCDYNYCIVCLKIKLYYQLFYLLKNNIYIPTTLPTFFLLQPTLQTTTILKKAYPGIIHCLSRRSLSRMFKHGISLISSDSIDNTLLLVSVLQIFDNIRLSGFDRLSSSTFVCIQELDKLLKIKNNIYT